MGRKIKYSKEMKLEIIKRYLNGESASALANEYGMTNVVKICYSNGYIGIKC